MMEIIKNGDLLTYDDNGTQRCVGYLFDFAGYGIYSPDGKVPISKEDADKHNAALSKAEVDGLIHNCDVGQYGTFYYCHGQVQTFTGYVVSTDVTISPSGRCITFRVDGKVFRGRLQSDADCFNFRRVV